MLAGPAPPLLEAIERRLAVQMESLEHRIIVEVGKAIADSEGRLNGWIDALRDKLERRFDAARDRPPMTPERAHLVARRYQAMAENLAGVPGEAARAKRQSERWVAYADALAGKPPGEAQP